LRSDLSHANSERVAVSDLTLVELFAGIGGFSCGFERAGVRTVAAVEIDPVARSVLAKNYPAVALFDDVTKVGGDELRAVGFVPGRGIITAGWPCQDISIAGRGAGLAGDRSGLFDEVVRLINDLQPAWFVLENVPRLLSINEGRDMGTVVGNLAECGYSFAWRVLDSSGFGVPQQRRRIFFVGHLGADNGFAAEVLFESESGGGDHCASQASKKTVAGTRPGRLRTVGGAVAALTATGVGTCGADDNQAQAGHLVVAPTGVRRVIPLECERLQGFPDHWTSGQSDAARYRMLGNAVAVPVVEWIAKRLVEVDERMESGQRREGDH
jgi:DNA (cytosine-5)-methyltransferase 1